MKHIYLVLTEQCNLACDFCYVTNKQTFMSRETFLEYYGSLPASDYKISFFGGEPLINWELLEFIVEYTKSDHRCKGYEIYSNGILLDRQMAEYIKLNKIDFFWSCKFNSIPDNIGLLKEVSKEIRILVTPNNMDILESHLRMFFATGISPSFRIIRDDVWCESTVSRFLDKFSEYIDYLKNHPNQIPTSIYRELEYIYKAAQGQKRYLCCIDRTLDTLMPDGCTGLCEKLVNSGIEDKYSKELYDTCNNCDIRDFCEKGCYEQVLRNGRPLKYLCSIYKGMFSELVGLDRELSERSYEPWKKFVNSLMI